MLPWWSRARSTAPLTRLRATNRRSMLSATMSGARHASAASSAGDCVPRAIAPRDTREDRRRDPRRTDSVDPDRSHRPSGDLLDRSGEIRNRSSRAAAHRYKGSAAPHPRAADRRRRTAAVRHQPVEHHAQRVHVAAAVDLGCHRAAARDSCRRACPSAVRARSGSSSECRGRSRARCRNREPSAAPVSETSTLAGFRSRWMMPRSCACWTAWQTAMTSSMRARERQAACACA